MTFTYYISDTKKLVMKRITGLVNLPGIKHILKVVWDDPVYDPSFKGILDLRDAEVLITVSEISTLTGILRSNQRSAKGRYAVLVKKPLETALAMIYETKMMGKQKVAVYSEVAHALKFVNITRKDFSALDGDEAHRIEINLENSPDPSLMT